MSKNASIFRNRHIYITKSFFSFLGSGTVKNENLDRSVRASDGYLLHQKLRVKALNLRAFSIPETSRTHYVLTENEKRNILKCAE